jgi:hypothetical protein
MKECSKNKRSIILKHFSFFIFVHTSSTNICFAYSLLIIIITSFCVCVCKYFNTLSLILNIICCIIIHAIGATDKLQDDKDITGTEVLINSIEGINLTSLSETNLTK